MLLLFKLTIQKDTTQTNNILLANIYYTNTKTHCNKYNLFLIILEIKYKAVKNLQYNYIIF